MSKWHDKDMEIETLKRRVKELEHLTLVKQVTLEDQADCITTLAAEMMRREANDE